MYRHASACIAMPSVCMCRHASWCQFAEVSSSNADCWQICGSRKCRLHVWTCRFAGFGSGCFGFGSALALVSAGFGFGSGFGFGFGLALAWLWSRFRFEHCLGSRRSFVSLVSTFKPLFRGLWECRLPRALIHVYREFRLASDCPLEFRLLFRTFPLTVFFLYSSLQFLNVGMGAPW